MNDAEYVVVFAVILCFVPAAACYYMLPTLYVESRSILTVFTQDGEIFFMSLLMQI